MAAGSCAQAEMRRVIVHGHNGARLTFLMVVTEPGMTMLVKL